MKRKNIKKKVTDKKVTNEFNTCSEKSDPYLKKAKYFSNNVVVDNIQVIKGIEVVYP
jgi:hypothetical protein